MTQERKSSLEELIVDFLDPNKADFIIQHHLRSLNSILASLPNLSTFQDSNSYQNLFISLSKALKLSKISWRFARHCFQSEHPPFKSLVFHSDDTIDEPKSKIAKRCSLNDDSAPILEACLIFVESDHFFRSLWPWSQLLTILTHNSGIGRKSVWLVSEVIGIAYNLPKRQRYLLCSNHMSEETYLRIAAEFLNNGHLHQDLLTISRNADQLLSCELIDSEFGIPLLKTTCLNVEQPSSKSFKFVSLKTREKIMIQLKLCVLAGDPVALSGPSGSGKTILVEHLANKTGRSEFVDFHRLQISDETDSRTLLGSYTCTTTPGIFTWCPGILTQAVSKGHWLLLEDVHQASDDVLSTIRAFVENGTLLVASRDMEIRPLPDFQLFFTLDDCLSDQWAGILKIIQCTPYSVENLIEIALSLFPNMSQAIPKVAQIISFFNDSHNVPLSRHLTIRDLLLWCQRCSLRGLLNREVMMEESIHVFSNHLKGCEERKFRNEILANLFQVDSEMSKYYGEGKFATIVNMEPPDLLRIGDRVIKIKCDVSDLERDTFCFTQEASILMDFLSSAIQLGNPVLLVGETGVGKTSVVQYLGKLKKKHLQVVNVCDNSESSDLFGSFKPVDISVMCKALIQEFSCACKQIYSKSKNAKFLGCLHEALNDARYSDVASLISHACDVALSDEKKVQHVKIIWQELKEKAYGLSEAIVKGAKSTFAFEKGVLTKAVENGDWVLLDEINLAEKEALYAVCSLFTNDENLRLNDGRGSIVKKHPDFRLFCCMNPSTDVGKKDLPEKFRSYFSEFFLDEPRNTKDICLLVKQYLKMHLISDSLALSLVNLFLSIKQLSRKCLNDGMGKQPSFSLRTLCRALTIASKNHCQNLQRSLFEAFAVCFLTELDRESYGIVLSILMNHILEKSEKKQNFKVDTTINIPAPKSSKLYVQIEGFWIRCGSLQPLVRDDYILTETVRRNLKDVSRVISFSSLPVLLQGETSVGKTSLIKYLAQATGNKLLRINNHEHTDIQEYVGSYGPDSQGNFVFKEGLLARAMREGSWLILDELNLASTEILESLNRVLDDNRELYIPETQVKVAAHDNFRVFATQNPAGVYGGRKTLSRAFRNRFIEIHFDELGNKELEEVIQKKSGLPKGLAKKMIKVMTELQIQRKASETFRGKRGFITLRDLFRWASRYVHCQQSKNFYDWDQHMAEEGYLVLSCRCRKEDEVSTVRNVLTKVFKKTLPLDFFSLESPALALKEEINLIKNMRTCDLALTSSTVRVMALLLHSFRYREPVLLVGGTGLGKTSICQVVAQELLRAMFTVNCHLNSDASDFLGSLRPYRDHQSNSKLFEWVDGPLITAMQEGGLFLLDEISLADDSVIERINSVLEDDRIMVVPEKPSSTNEKEVSEIRASNNFLFCATMNPGGDFGKRELSPALRNRFMEIWCPSYSTKDDLMVLLTYLLKNMVHENLIEVMADFLCMFNKKMNGHFKVSYRDVRAWVDFILAVICQTKKKECAIVHGICLVLLDGLETLNINDNRDFIAGLKQDCYVFFRQAFGSHNCGCFRWILHSHQEKVTIRTQEKSIYIGEFPVPVDDKKLASFEGFDYEALTIQENMFRVARGLQIKKPVLLEGPPGAGKSALVQAFAKATGNELTRINLSEQTDIADLFGADLPNEQNELGKFSWHDGPFLAAMKAGRWILLDELNLASQSVLEGLNGCLDHRGEIYIPELKNTFKVQARSKIFATQNPYKDGAGRKGLPSSFLNRFIKVYAAPLTFEDCVQICCSQFKTLEIDLVRQLVQAAERVKAAEEILRPVGGPWIINLRDILKWCKAIADNLDRSDLIYHFGSIIFINRFRSLSDREVIKSALISEDKNISESIDVGFSMTDDLIKIGNAYLKRTTPQNILVNSQNDHHTLIPAQYPVMENLIHCINNNWIPILVGKKGCGKTAVVNILSRLAGRKLTVVTLNSMSDASELLGTFEQTDQSFHATRLLRRMLDLCQKIIRTSTSKESLSDLYTNTKDFEKRIEESPSFDEKFCLMEDFCAYISKKAPHKQDEIRQISAELQKLQLFGKKHRFEWVDSVLVEAVINGHWLMIENANFCSASVLDRLNGLFESDGGLEIGEGGCLDDGKVRRLIPHPDFRVFITMDPKYGELSPAMRNRCVELYLDICYSDAIAELSTELSSRVGLSLHELKWTIESDFNAFRWNKDRLGTMLSLGKTLEEATSISSGFKLVLKTNEYLNGPIAIGTLERHSDTAIALWQSQTLYNFFGKSFAAFKIALITYVKFSSFSNLKQRLKILTLSFPIYKQTLDDVLTNFELLFDENHEDHFIDPRFFNLRECQTERVNHRLFNIEVFLSQSKRFDLEVTSEDCFYILESLNNMTNQYLCELRQLSFEKSNENFILMWRLTTLFDNIRNAVAVSEDDESIVSQFITIGKYYLTSLSSNLPGMVKTTNMDTFIATVLKLRKSTNIWPVFTQVSNCRRYQQWIHESKRHNPFEVTSFESLQLFFNPTCSFSQFDFFGLCLDDIVLNNYNLLCASQSNPNLYFQASRLHPPSMKASIRLGNLGADQNWTLLSWISLYDMLDKPWTSFFFPEENDKIGLQKLSLNNLFHSLFSKTNFLTLFKLDHYQDVTKLLNVSYSVLGNIESILKLRYLSSIDVDQSALQKIKIGEESLICFLEKLLEKLNATEAPKDLYNSLSLLATESKMLKQRKENPKDVILGKLKINLGLSLFLLTYHVALDTKDIFEAEMNFLQTECTKAEQVMKSEAICFFLSTRKNAVVHHPLTSHFENLISNNKEKISILSTSIPTRIESHYKLSLILEQAKYSSLNPARITDMIKKLENNVWMESDEEEYRTWKMNVIKLAQDFELNFSSFQDIWTVVLLGMSQIISGLELIKSHHVNVDKSEKIKTINLLSTMKISDLLMQMLLSSESISSNENHFLKFLLFKERKSYLTELGFELSMLENKTKRRILKRFISKPCATADVFLVFYKNFLEYSTCTQPPDATSASLPGIHRNAIHHSQILREKYNMDLNLIDQIAFDLEPIKLKVTKLYEAWPENPLLLAIERGIQRFREHTVMDKKIEFQISLETLVKDIEEWNRVAHKEIRIEANTVINHVKRWHAEELEAFKNIPKQVSETLSKEDQNELIIVRTWLDILSSVTLKGKPKWLAAILLSHANASSPIDFLSKVKSLQVIVASLSSTDNRGNVLKRVENLLAGLKEAIEQIYYDQFANTGKRCRELYKILKVNRLESSVKIAKEKRKLEAKCRECLTIPFQSPIEVQLKTNGLSDELFNDDCCLFEAVKNPVLEFSSSDGIRLGNSNDMREKVLLARNKIRSCLIKEDLLDGDVLEIEKRLIACDKNSSKDLYSITKSIEGLFRELREHGISFRRGNMYNVSALSVVSVTSYFGKEKESHPIFSCLLSLDHMKSALLRPQRHVSPVFLERAQGFASDILLEIIKAEYGIQSSLVKVTEMRKFLHSVTHSKENMIRKRIENVKNILSDLHRLCKVESSELLKRIEALLLEVESLQFVRFSHDKKSFHCTLEKCLKEINSIVSRYEQLKKHLPMMHLDFYHTSCKLKSEMSKMKCFLETTIESDDRSENEIVEVIKKFSIKCMNAVTDVKKKALSFSARNDTHDELVTLSSMMKKIESLVRALKLRKRYFDLMKCYKSVQFLSATKKNRETECLILYEVMPILEQYLKTSENVCYWAKSCLEPVYNFVFHFTGLVRKYVSAKFRTEDTEGNETGEQVDNDERAEAQEGCGLGEGTGDKSTVEDMESEDLFDNPQNGEESETNDKNDMKNDEFVDYSEEMDGEMKDEEKEDGDEEEDNEEEDPFEEGKAQDDDHHTEKDDEILNAEDWGEQEDDQELQEKSKNKSDAMAPNKNTDNTEKSEEDKDVNDVVEENDLENRERQPDAEDTEDICNDMKDEFHLKDHQDEEIEDFDLPDNDIGDDGKSEDGDLSDNDAEMDDEIERLPDFKEDEQENNETHVDAPNQALEDKNVQASKDEQNKVSQNSHSGAENEKERDENKKEENFQNGALSEDFDANANQCNQNAEIEKMDMREEEVGQNNDVMDDEDDQFNVDENKIESISEEPDVDLPEIIPSKGSMEMKESKQYSHIGEANQESETATAVDSTPFESIKDLKQKLDPNERQNDLQSTTEKKNYVQQPLVAHLDDDDDIMKSNIVSRGTSTFAHNLPEVKTSNSDRVDINQSLSDLSIRLDVGICQNADNFRYWNHLCAFTQELAQTLAERLRLIIEPTKKSRLKGDYSSGKRLNMRRIIPYIASNFRKDKIWLRRTKPNKRECEVLIAVDNSSSMSDNNVQEVAFQALATLCQALSVLEIGQLGIARFGSDACMVSDFKNHFSSSDGANIVSKFTFDCKVTKLLNLLKLANLAFRNQKSASLMNKLLIILSDGKGVLHEGKPQIIEAVREARLMGVFIVYIILEAPGTSESVLDIRMPIFDEKNNLLGIESYMEHFPFPFYIILRDFQNLPYILSDALRQWLEMVMTL